MKIEKLETHDRLLHFKKDQSLNIAKGAEDCLKRNPLSLGLQQYSKYIYLFAHPRTSDDGVTKRMIWQPRLSKPIAQTNSYLFRAHSHTDIIETIWLLPPREMWPQYKKGNITEHETVLWSIDMFTNYRYKLDKSDPEDLDDATASSIYLRVAREMDEENRKKKNYTKLTSSEASLIS